MQPVVRCCQCEKEVTEKYEKLMLPPYSTGWLNLIQLQNTVLGLHEALYAEVQ